MSRRTVDFSPLERMGGGCTPTAVRARRCHRSAWQVAILAGLTLLAITTVASAAMAEKVEDFTTPGGIRVWLVEERAIPLVSIRFAFSGGAMQDPAGREGLATLVSALLTEGAGHLDSTAFARRLTDEGAQISFSGGRDRLAGGLDVVADRLDAAADLLRLTLIAPRFDTEAFERTKTQRLADLELAASEPRRIASERWYAESFPGHRSSRPVDGTVETVSAMTHEELINLAPLLLTKSALTVVIVGAVDTRDAARLVDRIFGDLPAGTSTRRIAKPVQKRRGKPISVERDLPQVTVAFGATTIGSDHPDFPALQVLNQIIGSGDFDSTLMDEIRVKRGLAYAVSTSIISDPAAAVLLGGMSTNPENAAQALDVLRSVLVQSATLGPTREQFDNAKSYLMGTWRLDFDSNTKLAGALLRLRLDGRTPQFLEQRNAGIDRVSIDDVRRIAREALEWEQFNVIVVGRTTAR